MKKQLLSFMLTLCLVMSLVPATALAEENGQESKTVITAVDELLQFAKDVNTITGQMRWYLLKQIWI